MWRLILQIIAGILGIWLSIKFVPGVDFIGEAKYFFLASVVLGLLNFFIRPILNIITLPLRVLTFGLFALVINMIIVWLLDLVFPELIIVGITALFWMSMIVWLLSWFLPKMIGGKKF